MHRSYHAQKSNKFILQLTTQKIPQQIYILLNFSSSPTNQAKFLLVRFKIGGNTSLTTKNLYLFLKFLFYSIPIFLIFANNNGSMSFDHKKCSLDHSVKAGKLIFLLGKNICKSVFLSEDFLMQQKQSLLFSIAICLSCLFFQTRYTIREIYIYLQNEYFTPISEPY